MLRRGCLSRFHITEKLVSSRRGLTDTQQVSIDDHLIETGNGLIVVHIGQGTKRAIGDEIVLRQVCDHHRPRSDELLGGQMPAAPGRVSILVNVTHSALLSRSKLKNVGRPFSSRESVKKAANFFQVVKRRDMASGAASAHRVGAPQRVIVIYELYACVWGRADIALGADSAG
jgi:hypothetical protein